MKRHTLKEIRECLDKSAEYLSQGRRYSSLPNDWWRGTANGLWLAKNLLEGQIIGDVLPRFLVSTKPRGKDE